MFFLDILFPKLCLICSLPGNYLCLRCQKKLSPIEADSCIYCGRKSYGGLTHPLCVRRLGLDGVISLYHYNPAIKKVMQAIKYRLAHEVWSDFAAQIPIDLTEKILFYKKNIINCVLEPIPLHEKRLKERGFNQAELIADYCFNYLKFPLTHHLIRKRYTTAQAKITNSKERYENMKDAFELENECDVNGKSIILVDDVVTSGSTLKDAARVLKLKKAAAVYAITLARG